MVNLIAEIGCNHKGDFELAKSLVDIYSNYSRAYAIKFQKRNPKELLTEEEYNSPHPVPYNSYGRTYGEHREFLEFTIEQHAELKSLCEKNGVIYSCSVWDKTSAHEIASLSPDFIKVPSAKNTNKDILKILRDNYNGDIHVSLGMTTRREEKDIMNFFEGQHKRLTLYACTSGYPIEFKDACILEVKRLKELWGKDVKSIGYSSHALGIAIDIGIATLLECNGYIERHVTGFGGRVWKGTDHAASLEPDGFRKLSRDLKALEEAYTYKNLDILPIESEQRKKLGKDNV